MKRWPVLGAALAFSVVLVAVALAGGGTSILTAPTIQPGVRVFGNTAEDPTGSLISCGAYAIDHVEFWLLPLTAGDLVEIQWTATPPARGFLLCVLQPGTDDGNIGVDRLVYSVPELAMSGKYTFKSAASGKHPLAVGPYTNDSQAGPFSFVVYAYHKALVFLPAVSRIRVTGKLTVDLRTPSGSPITDASLRLRGCPVGGGFSSRSSADWSSSGGEVCHLLLLDVGGVTA